MPRSSQVTLHLTTAAGRPRGGNHAPQAHKLLCIWQQPPVVLEEVIMHRKLTSYNLNCKKHEYHMNTWIPQNKTLTGTGDFVFRRISAFIPEPLFCIGGGIHLHILLSKIDLNKKILGYNYLNVVQYRVCDRMNVEKLIFMK